VHRKVAIESALADLQVLRKSKVELLHKWKVPCQIKEEGQQDKWVKPEKRVAIREETKEELKAKQERQEALLHNLQTDMDAQAEKQKSEKEALQ